MNEDGLDTGVSKIGSESVGGVLLPPGVEAPVPSVVQQAEASLTDGEAIKGLNAIKNINEAYNAANSEATYLKNNPNDVRDVKSAQSEAISENEQMNGMNKSVDIEDAHDQALEKDEEIEFEKLGKREQIVNIVERMLNGEPMDTKHWARLNEVLDKVQNIDQPTTPDQAKAAAELIIEELTQGAELPGNEKLKEQIHELMTTQVRLRIYEQRMDILLLKHRKGEKELKSLHKSWERAKGTNKEELGIKKWNKALEQLASQKRMVNTYLAADTLADEFRFKSRELDRKLGLRSNWKLIGDALGASYAKSTRSIHHSFVRNNEVVSSREMNRLKGQMPTSRAA